MMVWKMETEILSQRVFALGRQANMYTTTLTITDAYNCEQENIVSVHFTSIDPMIESDPGVYIW